MLFRRRGNGEGGILGSSNSASLPTTSSSAPSTFHFSNISQTADGSGKAIRMEAPIAREWKRQSTYTKGTYYCLVGFLVLFYVGFRWLRYSHVSIWLTCHAQECKLEITPKGFQGTTTVEFPRRQLIKAESIKTNKLGDFVAVSARLDDFHDATSSKKGGKYAGSGRKPNYKGADLNGHYPSYRISFRDATTTDNNKNENGEEQENENTDVETDLKDLLPFTERDEDGDLALIMRKFHIHQSRRRASTSARKVDSYIKNRRQKLVLKENAAPCWQGIVFVVVGLMGFLLTLLLGQFWDDPPKKHSGPGIRRQQQQHELRRKTYPKHTR